MSRSESSEIVQSCFSSVTLQCSHCHAELGSLSHVLKGHSVVFRCFSCCCCGVVFFWGGGGDIYYACIYMTSGL